MNRAIRNVLQGRPSVAALGFAIVFAKLENVVLPNPVGSAKGGHGGPPLQYV